MRNRTYNILLALLLAAAATGCSPYKVYSVRDNPPLRVGGGVLYALPRTQLSVDVTVEHRDVSNAPYRDYAADYLGIGAESLDTGFRIVGIEVGSANVADPDNYYFIDVRRGQVTVDERHLLLAVGVANPADNVQTPSPLAASDPAGGVRVPTAAYNLYDRSDTLYTRYDTRGKPSLVSTRKDVRSVRQRAAAAAERLDEVQSKQQELLNGEYEGSYGADAVQYLYASLQRQEEQIVALFCGEMRRETVRFYIDPQFRRGDDVVDTVVWFSASEGFLGYDGSLPSDAFPVVCSVGNNSEMKSAARFVKYHTSGTTSNSSSGRTGTAAAKYRSRKGFRYRIPVVTSVTVSTPSYSVSRQLPVSQLGPVVELPRRRIKALFDANTLDLKKLERK